MATRNSKGRFVKGSSAAKSKKTAPCSNCKFAPGLVDENTLCPVCQGSGQV